MLPFFQAKAVTNCLGKETVRIMENHGDGTILYDPNIFQDLPKFTCFSGVAQAKHRPEVSGLGLVGTNQRDTSE